MARLTIQELDQFLSKQGADFEFLHHEKPIKSRYDALNYFRLEEMAPTLIVRTEKGMFAIIKSLMYLDGMVLRCNPNAVLMDDIKGFVADLEKITDKT